MKQKKNPKDYTPSSDEIKASDACQQLEFSFNNFQQSESNSESKDKFNQLINTFNSFLNEETNIKLLQYFSPIVIQNIIDHISLTEFNSSLINQIFSLINLIVSKVGIIFSSSTFMNLFLYLSNGEKERFQSLKNNEKTVSDVFADEHFFYELVSSSMFDFAFQKIFINVASKEICLFYSNLIFEIAPNNLLSDYDYQPIINSLQQKSTDIVSPEIAVFLTYLFSLNAKYKLFFNDKENFDLLSDLLASASFDTDIECFKYLIYIEPPNLDLFKNIFYFYQNNVRVQDQLFDWIFEFVQSNPEIVNKVNSIVPFSSWVSSKTPVTKLLDFMKLINSINNSLVSQFLSLYFSLLCKEESDVDSYICGIGIVESQIFHRHISLLFLLNSLFLNAFIVKPSIELLNQIFEKSYTFPQLVYDIYALPDAKPIRQEVLGKIIQVSMKNTELTSIVSAFLVISDSGQNLREMMKLIETSNNGDLCNAFCSAFPKSEVLTSNFLKEYGMAWVDSIFNKKIIDIEMVKNLLIGLTSRVSVQNVDDFIESLPKTHPLFKLESDNIRSLIYGCEDPPAFYPIKLYSLFHLIPCPWSIDPYNASIVGKKVLSKYDDILNLPIISEIGNRYITDDIFFKFLEKPTELEQFADPSYDHFPLFQVFEFTDEKIFDLKFKSISFWFRFASEIDESLKIPFFHASKFNLFLKKNNLVANYEGTEYEVPINPLKWNHIFVSISSNLISHKVKVWVNLSKAVFTSPTKLNELSNFGFLVYASFLFIGPSIRIYQDKCHELNKIFELGPSSLKKLNEDIHITPTFDNFPLDLNILPVPYFGFPEHFKSRSKIEYFFEIMKKNVNNDEVFEKLLSLYYKLFMILKFSMHDFFTLLLTFFASIPNCLTKDRFINVLSFFGTHKNQKNLLDEIIKHQFFWKKVSNDIIIFSLISYFKTFDFYDEIDKFQFFLSNKMLDNQGSKYIMTSFLVNSKALPKCQKCLVALFLSHHFMCHRRSRETQCSIQFKDKRDAQKTIENSIDETCQYFQAVGKRSVSVQCDIETESAAFCGGFDEQLLLFNDVVNTELQFTLIDCIYDFFLRAGTVENVKNMLPMEDLLSLFIVSENKFKAELFKIFALIEKMSPGFIVVNNLFLTAFFPLFVYQNVWDETMKLVSDDSITISSNSNLIQLLLALIWSLTAASLHSVAQTGQKLAFSFDKEVKFCSSNSAVFANNKAAQHFFRVWYPLLLGFANDRGDFTSSPVRLENVEIIPPKVPDFSNHVWKTVILSVSEVDDRIPLKTGNFYRKEFREFVSSSELIIFLINVSLSCSENQFTSLFTSFLLIPSISQNDISEEFVGDFVTNCLTFLSQTFSVKMPFMSFVPFLHYLSSHGLLKANLQFVLSDIFVILSLLYEMHNKVFKKVTPQVNNLMIDLLSNCDSESYHLLFSILQQNVNLFTKLVQITGTIDLYLTIFQKVAHNCYKEFDFFFKKFLEVSELKTSNKKVANILNHQQLTDDTALNKLNKSISYSANLKQLKYEKNDCYNSMMAELHENSKEFALTYFISCKRQHDICRSLANIFSSLEDKTKMQDYFNESIKMLSKAAIDAITIKGSEKVEIKSEGKRLLPFSFPLALPRLFVPIVVHSKSDVVNFIKDNKLYSTKVTTFQPLEKTSIPRARQSSLILESKSSSSQLKNTSQPFLTAGGDSNSAKEAPQRRMKRSNSLRSVSSQPIPKADSFLIDNLNQLQPIGSENHFNATLSHAMTNSSFVPYSSFNVRVSPMIFNCKLTRFNYSMETIVSISNNNLRLIPFCRYTSPHIKLRGSEFFDISTPCANYPLEAEFVEKFVTDVINGFWGETSLFEKRIVIKIPLNSILFVTEKSQKSFIFWTQKNGAFILDNVENEVFKKAPFSELNPFSSSNKSEYKREVIQKWTAGSLSSSQAIVALNICEKRDYIDLRSFIRFPNDLSVFGTFSPINESMAANLTEGLMIGNEKYSNTIELSENEDAIIKFFKNFDITEQISRPNRGQPQFTINSTILCQKICGNISNSTLVDDNYFIKTLPPLSARISQPYPFYVIVDKGEMSISIFDLQMQEKVFTYHSEDFSIAKSISVSQNFMFVAVDLENDTSNTYRIVYEMYLPTKIEFIRENSFCYSQQTDVTGSELLAGTASGKTVYIWPLYRFSYHRIINFEEEIRFCKFDDNAGTIWICDDFTCYLYDINGKLFSSYKFEKQITSFVVVPQPIHVCDRSAICGFIDGSVALISPKIETGELCFKELHHYHQSKIIKITFHPQNTYFITIDNCQNAYFWTQKNSNEFVKEMDISIFDCCPSCGKKPYKFCSSCKRAFCSDCSKESQTCPDCSFNEK